MRPQATTASTAYSRKNVRMLVTTHAVLTVGETPLAVFMSPCTIHGCRPFSVSIQPAVLMTNGSGTTQPASRRNHPGRASLPRQIRQHPHSAKRNTTAAVYAMTRMDQYWTKTLGT